MITVKEFLQKNWVRYAKSLVLTFIAGMAIGILAVYDEYDSIKSLMNGGYVGLVFAGGRTGLKLVLEMLVLLKKK
jgi:hypothetical protein